MPDRLAQEGAYADVTVKLGLVKLLKKTFDICEEAYVNGSLHACATVLLTNTPLIRRKANATIQCPVEKGDYVVEQTVTLPKEIPPGMSAAYSLVQTWLTVV